MAGLTAPVDGTLYSQPAKAGDFVKLGDLLAEMADLHKVRVRAFIDEPELGALEPNQAVKITWMPCRIGAGGEDGNYSEAGGSARISKRGRATLLR